MNFIGEKGQWHFESHDSDDTCHDAETNPQLFVKTAGTFPQFDFFLCRNNTATRNAHTFRFVTHVGIRKRSTNGSYSKEQGHARMILPMQNTH